MEFLVMNKIFLKPVL